jgi:adenosine deaminase
MKTSCGLSVTDIRQTPKIDLHRHLLGSIRPETLWELSRKYGLAVGRQSLDDFRSAVVHGAPPLTLERYIRPWKLFREVIQNPEDVRRIACEAAIDAYVDGVCYVEFRSSLPGMPVTDGQAPQTRIPPDEYLAAIHEAFSESQGIVCRLVASVPRHAVGRVEGPLILKYAKCFIDVAARFRDLVVGVDLTGIEHGWPARLFQDFFTEARAAGFPVTIHAGETEGPDEIWDAIDRLGASRIGHGTSAPIDPRLVVELIKRRVVLEVCPTACWLIGSVMTRERHPVIDCVPTIPFVICTDNPTLNASTHSQELLIAAEISRMEPTAFLKSQLHTAAQAVFAPAALASAIELDRRET